MKHEKLTKELLCLKDELPHPHPSSAIFRFDPTAPVEPESLYDVIGVKEDIGGFYRATRPFSGFYLTSMTIHKRFAFILYRKPDGKETRSVTINLELGTPAAVYLRKKEGGE